MKRFKVGSKDSIKPGCGIALNLLGKKYAVFNIDGNYYGMDGACRHMKAALVKGKITGTIVTCSMHDWQYDITSGRCLTEDWASVNTYPVEIENGIVYIIID
ncbi:MAG: Rieske 2Fe-2S domain-containing protein [candidate division Zixibacteria bacterium]|nr:Rieske 2Fe-2S domain-containing protein [candidate division Zixibacteria bacterium]